MIVGELVSDFVIAEGMIVEGMFVGDMLVDKIMDIVMAAFGSFVADSVGSEVWVQWLQ
ncbi:hypothetical protein A2U01_0117057, partial [Trifolium medium]|nr:hypothetical protein [Trifolium medium]